MFLTDVAFGTSNVLEQDVKQDRDMCHQSGIGWGGYLWGAETDTSLTHVTNVHVGLEIKNNHKHI